MTKKEKKKKTNAVFLRLLKSEEVAFPFKVKLIGKKHFRLQHYQKGTFWAKIPV